MGEEKLAVYREYIQKELSEKRYLHSLNTAKIALGLYQNLPDSLKDESMPFRLESAALLHDVTKELSVEKHRAMLFEAGEPGATALPGPVLHAYSGAIAIAARFQISDSGILHAVKYHTTGCGQMPLLSRLVFAADFIESAPADQTSDLQKLPLHEICLKKLASTFLYLMHEKRPVQDDSLQFYNTLVTSG